MSITGGKMKLNLMLGLLSFLPFASFAQSNCEKIFEIPTKIDIDFPYYMTHIWIKVDPKKPLDLNKLMLSGLKLTDSPSPELIIPNLKSNEGNWFLPVPYLQLRNTDVGFSAQVTRSTVPFPNNSTWQFTYSYVYKDNLKKECSFSSDITFHYSNMK